jgi:hypothetical protein
VAFGTDVAPFDDTVVGGRDGRRTKEALVLLLPVNVEPIDGRIVEEVEREEKRELEIDREEVLVLLNEFVLAGRLIADPLLMLLVEVLFTVEDLFASPILVVLPKDLDESCEVADPVDTADLVEPIDVRLTDAEVSLVGGTVLFEVRATFATGLLVTVDFTTELFIVEVNLLLAPVVVVVGTVTGGVTKAAAISTIGIESVTIGTVSFVFIILASLLLLLSFIVSRLTQQPDSHLQALPHLRPAFLQAQFLHAPFVALHLHDSAVFRVPWFVLLALRGLRSSSPSSPSS